MTVNANMIQGAGQIMPDSSGQAYRNPAEKTKDNAVSFAEMMKSSMSSRQEITQNAKTMSDVKDQLSGFNVQAPVQRQGTNADTGTSKNTAKGDKGSNDPSGKEVLPQETVDAASSAVSDIAEGVTENVTEELDISEEHLDDVIETLELAYLDLLNPQALTQVVETVAEDIPEAVPDMDAAAIVGELVPANEEVVAAALDENGISLEDFSEFFSQVESGDIEIPEEIAELLPTSQPGESDGLPEMTAAIFESAAEETGQSASQPEVVSESVTVTVIRIEDDAFDQNPAVESIMVKEETFDGAKLPENMTEAFDSGITEESFSETGIPAETLSTLSEDIAEETALPVAGKAADSVETDSDSSDTSFFDNLTASIADDISEEAGTQSFGSSDDRQGSQLFSGQDTAASAMNVRNDLMADAAAISQQQNNFAQTLAQTAEQAPVTPYSPAQTADIMNQIVTQASVTINETVSRMEMELNPQNLGRMIMQVQQQEGMVTARLIAQNENVRNAIENQLMQLRENLEQKGIKVDAVEVTVGTHEFERNLEEGMSDQTFEGQQENSSEQQNRAGRNRNLNRGELETMAGDLTEEEALAARIMRDNGGTVDYTA